MKNGVIIFSLVILLFSCATRLTSVNDYNYKTIIDKNPNKNEYNHFNKKSFDNICEIEYGFLKNAGLIKAYNADGKLVARCGPPFIFFIDLEKINRDIEYIKFDKIELITKSTTYDLLNLYNISYQTYINFNGKLKEKNYSPDNFFWEMDDFQTLQQIKNERSINITGLRSKGLANIEKRIEKLENEYTEEEIKMLSEERRLDFKFSIERIPINVDSDDEITVKVSLLFLMANGNIQSIQFEDVYFREYSIINYSSLFFIELLPEEKNVKL